MDHRDDDNRSFELYVHGERSGGANDNKDHHQQQQHGTEHHRRLSAYSEEGEEGAMEEGGRRQQRLGADGRRVSQAKLAKSTERFSWWRGVRVTLLDRG